MLSERLDDHRDHVKQALARLVELGGSDLCLKAGNRPLARLDGLLQPPDPDAYQLTPDDTLEMLHALLSDGRLKEFEREHEVDFAFSVPGLARFRANAMTMTGRVHDLILDRERTAQLADVIAEGGYYGMQTFDQALYKAVRDGVVSEDDGIRYATRPHDPKLLLATGGQLHTTMDSVAVHEGEPEDAAADAGPHPASPPADEVYASSGFAR